MHAGPAQINRHGGGAGRARAVRVHQQGPIEGFGAVGRLLRRAEAVGVDGADRGRQGLDDADRRVVEPGIIGLADGGPVLGEKLAAWPVLILDLGVGAGLGCQAVAVRAVGVIGRGAGNGDGSKLVRLAIGHRGGADGGKVAGRVVGHG